MLKDEYHTSNELDEINPDPSGDQNDVYDDESVPPAPKLQGNFSHTTNQPSTSATNSATVFNGDKGGTTSDVDYWIQGTRYFIFVLLDIYYDVISENTDFFYLYVVLLASVLVLIMMVMAVFVRMVLQRRIVNDPSQLKTNSEERNELSQTHVSEQDMDLTTPMSIPSISKDDVSVRIYI